MRENFQSLSDKFSTLNATNDKDFLSFYEANTGKIADLKGFESDEELYLAVVINHTYGRSQLYELKDYRKAEHFLSAAKTLILEHKDKFGIELNEDTWYLETLQHLLRLFLIKKERSNALKILKELEAIDRDNKRSYKQVKVKIKRAQKYKILMTTACIGIGLLAIAVGYKFIMNTPLWHLGNIGEVLAVVGLVGAYFFRDSVNDNTPDIIDTW